MYHYHYWISTFESGYKMILSISNPSFDSGLKGKQLRIIVIITKNQYGFSTKRTMTAMSKCEFVSICPSSLQLGIESFAHIYICEIRINLGTCLNSHCWIDRIDLVWCCLNIMHGGGKGKLKKCWRLKTGLDWKLAIIWLMNKIGI